MSVYDPFDEAARIVQINGQRVRFTCSMRDALERLYTVRAATVLGLNSREDALEALVRAGCAARLCGGLYAVTGRGVVVAEYLWDGVVLSESGAAWWATTALAPAAGRSDGAGGGDG